MPRDPYKILQIKTSTVFCINQLWHLFFHHNFEIFHNQKWLIEKSFLYFSIFMLFRFVLWLTSAERVLVLSKSNHGFHLNKILMKSCRGEIDWRRCFYVVLYFIFSWCAIMINRIIVMGVLQGVHIGINKIPLKIRIGEADFRRYFIFYCIILVFFTCVLIQSYQCSYMTKQTPFNITLIQ